MTTDLRSRMLDDARSTRVGWRAGCCVVLASALLACGGAEPVPPSTSGVSSTLPPSIASAPLPPAEPPLGRLPADVTPTRYRLELAITPTAERFSGTTEIDIHLSAATRRIYLHAQSLTVRETEVRNAAGQRWRAVLRSFGDTGVVAVETDAELPVGDYTLHFAYDAPFDQQLKGLYRVTAGGDAYAFTQFEAISARLAFPCFDEPRFKTPFEISIASADSERAISNTRETNVLRLSHGVRVTQFAPTQPLPTYLIAFAVGPFDVVDAPPIAANDVRPEPLPFRGIAARGKGKDLAHALTHTPPMVAHLEQYFGIAYPYDKLDIIAVPDFASGAMENAGAITFREYLLLLDAERATESQRRGYAYVMAHELAHQWFGNLVTMPWWDDIWLNEAFATWMGHRVVDALHPDYRSGLSLLESVHYAMSQDSLTSARVVRQPIETSGDILNAFDSITYSKGGGVLEMFERYVGAETFRAGLRAYMTAHRFGSATSHDLIAALGAAHGHDLEPAFNSFLTQAGVPLLQTELKCDVEGARVAVRQQRYLPLGSGVERERTWQLPLCVRWGKGDSVEQTCTLLTERDADVKLAANGCPDWYLPNADASAYVRFAQAPADLAQLRKSGWNRLNEREQLALADSLSAAFDAGALDAPRLLDFASVFAASAQRSVATAPIAWLSFAHDYLVDEALRARVEALGRTIYAPHKKRLGWTEQANEDGERRLLRAEVLSFLALEANDPATRREANQRGRAFLGIGGDGAMVANAVANDLVGIAVAVAVQEGGAAVFDHVIELLMKSEDAVLRDRLLAGLAATRDAALGDRSLALALDPRVRVNEAVIALSRQMREPARRDAAWSWLVANLEPLLARVGGPRGARLPWFAASFCTEAAIAPVTALFEPHLARLDGARRNLDGAREAIHLCAVKVEAQRALGNAYFARRKP